MKKTNNVSQKTPFLWWKRVSVLIVIASLFINMSLVTRAINVIPLVEEGTAAADEQTGALSEEQDSQPVMSLPLDDSGSTPAPAVIVEVPRPIGVPVGICVSPLDFNNGAGAEGPDGNITPGDAVEFTRRYMASYAKNNGEAGFDTRADVNQDGVVNGADFLCASPFYASGQWSCDLDCPRQQAACNNPLDYNSDYLITLDDGVAFTDYYENNNTLADLNGNAIVDYGDLLCSQDQLALNTYQCPVQCAPVCGDGLTQKFRGEQCDSGRQGGDEECNSFCHFRGQCDIAVADYNDDGNVTLGDAVLFTKLYSLEAPDIAADIDGNGRVDADDYNCMSDFVNTPVPSKPQITPNTNAGGGSTAGSSSAAAETPKVKVLGLELPLVNLVGPLISHWEQQAVPSETTKPAATLPAKKLTVQRTMPPVLVAGQFDSQSVEQPAVTAQISKAESKPWWFKPLAFLLAW